MAKERVHKPISVGKQLGALVNLVVSKLETIGGLLKAVPSPDAAEDALQRIAGELQKQFITILNKATDDAAAVAEPPKATASAPTGSENFTSPPKAEVKPVIHAGPSQTDTTVGRPIKPRKESDR